MTSLATKGQHSRATTRRPRGSGYRTKDKDGNITGWAVRVGSRAFYGKTQAEAKFKAEVARGAVVLTSSGTLGAYIADFLAGQKGSLAPQTWQRYEQLLRLHVVEHIGDLPLASIKESDIERLQSTLARGNGHRPLGGTTRRHVHVVLGGALEAARRRGLIPVNPVRNVSAPRNDLKENAPLSVADAKKLLLAARGDKYESLYILSLTTGLRPGEVMALHWGDIDIEGKTVTVRGNVVTGYDGRQIDKPKTARSRRTITLTKLAVDALTAYRNGAAAFDLIFPGRDGNPMAAGNLLLRHFRPLVGRAGLPGGTTLYTLRHTFATTALNNGVPLHIVSAILGHSSPVVTLRHYAHYITGDDTVGAASAQSLFG
jgi:integrase